MDLLCEKAGTGVCGQASAYWAGPRLCPGSALPCQHPYRTGVLGVLVTTPQPPVRAQAGDRGTHSRFLRRNLIHRCLLRDAGPPSQDQHFCLLQGEKKIMCGCTDRGLQQPDALEGSSLPHLNTISRGWCETLAAAGAQSARSP